MSIIFRILISFIFSLETASLNAKPLLTSENQNSFLADYEGVTWRCKRCKYYNYSESPDWKGDYFCLRCGTRKGDE